MSEEVRKDELLEQAQDALRDALWKLQEERQERLAEAIEDMIDVKITLAFEALTDAVFGAKNERDD